MGFKISKEPGEGDFFTVKELPIFQTHDDRGFTCDENWMRGAIENHTQYKKRDWRPPIIIGHNQKGGPEKEAVGFLDNLVLKGKQLYADLVRVPGEVIAKFRRNAYPNRSVEVLPNSKRIVALALLGGTTPHFPLPQAVYSEGEMSLWYRSPNMDGFTEEQKTELQGMIGDALAKAIPLVYKATEEAAQNGGSEGDEGAESDEQQYAGGVGALAGRIGQRISRVAGRVAKAAPGVARNVARVAPEVARGVGQAAVPAALVGGGYLLGKRRGRKQAQAAGYSIDDEGIFYLQGQPVGEVVLYEDEAPEDLPQPESVEVIPEIAEEAVGEGSDVDPTLQQDPGEITTDQLERLDREESPQFAAAGEDPVLYDLNTRLQRVEGANALLQAKQRVEHFSKVLQEKKAAGAPIGDIDKAVDFLMGLDAEQVKQYLENLDAAPKVQLGAIAREDPQNYNLDEVSQDFAKNPEQYKALGVTEKDLKFARFIR
jgi:hypothetical protein